MLVLPVTVMAGGKASLLPFLDLLSLLSSDPSDQWGLNPSPSTSLDSKIMTNAF